MKKMYYTLSVVCLLLVFGCKKDKDDLRKQIIGKWKLESIAYKLFVDNKEVTSESDIEYGSDDDVIEFKSDGKVTTGTDNDANSTVDYVLDEDKRTITIDNDIYSITEISKSKFVFKETGTTNYNGKSGREETIYSLKK